MVGAYWRHGRDGSTQWRINLMRRNGPASDMRSRVSLMCPATMLVKAIEQDSASPEIPIPLTII